MFNCTFSFDCEVTFKHYWCKFILYIAVFTLLIVIWKKVNEEATFICHQWQSQLSAQLRREAVKAEYPNKCGVEGHWFRLVTSQACWTDRVCMPSL